QTHGSIKFQGISTGCSFWVSEHYTYFFAQLVNENNGTFCLADGARKFSKRLAHQSFVEAHFAVAHFTLDFTFWGQCGDEVHNSNVNCTASDQVIRDFQSLFAIVGLWDD